MIPATDDILDSLGQGVICIDTDIVVTVFNLFSERITELSRSRSIGRPISEVFARNDWLVRVLEKTLSEGSQYLDYEDTLVRNISEPLPVAVTTHRIFGSEGELMGAVALIRDLKGIKPLEDETLRKERLAYIGTFAASLAHEVKNPLAGIKGAAELLSRRLTEQRYTEYTEIITKAADRLNFIVRQMLDLARPQALKREDINVHMLLDEVASLVESSYNGEVKLIKEYDPSLPPVWGDYNQLTQVMMNLVQNAVEATNGGGVVRLATRLVTDFHISVEDSEGQHQRKLVIVEVADTGPGMAKEEIEKIFAPFYTTKSGGSGLGMAISYRIIKEHDGLIKIDSEVDKGTSVKCYLPMAEASRSGNDKRCGNE